MSPASNAPRIGIIGGGLIGKKRLAALDPSQVKVVCDLDASRAEGLARGLPDCQVIASPEEAAKSGRIDALIVATANSSLAPLTLAAVKAGKHVLAEKPGALKSSQLEEIQTVARETGALVRIGFNHRFHPAFQKAQEIFQSGVLGPLMFIRARYGHGGRKGYDREWRADPALSGGGELMDQGVHLIDLAGWFMGEFNSIQGEARTYFWDMKVDDNAFIHLKNADQQTAWLHVSCTEWKNLFSFELYGKTGKLHIEGLGGSYGVERLYHYQMLPAMGPPDTVIHEYPRGDESWKLELQAFFEDIRLKRAPAPGLRESIQTLRVVEEIYRNSEF